MSKRFSSPNLDISYCKRENYDSIAKYYTLDVGAASAANGIIGNVTKPLDLSLFGSVANRYAIAFGLDDGNKKLALDTLRGKNINTIGNIKNSNTGGRVGSATDKVIIICLQLQLLKIFKRVILEGGLSAINKGSWLHLTILWIASLFKLWINGLLNRTLTFVSAGYGNSLWFCDTPVLDCMDSIQCGTLDSQTTINQ